MLTIEEVDRIAEGLRTCIELIQVSNINVVAKRIVVEALSAKLSDTEQWRDLINALQG